MSHSPTNNTKHRVMFSYWGRRGALSQFTIEVARTALASPAVTPTISVSRQNEAFASFAACGPALFPIDTFSSTAGAALAAWRIPGLRRALQSRLAADGAETVIELMPHVWSPLVMPAVKAAGRRYVTIIHDAAAHPGDRTGAVNRWLLRSCKCADRIITLSRTVTDQLQHKGIAEASRIVTLFHPDLTYGSVPPAVAPREGEPVRLMFLGRIMPYKGLSLFTDTIERLRAAGIPVEAGVFGAGDMGRERERLQRFGAEVVNRWLSEADIADAFARYHAVLVSHVEASQSGIVAAAHGAGRPVIVTPVGGLLEQVRHCVTGMVAERVTAASLADAATLLASDARLYETIVRNIAADKASRSMARFVDEVVAAATA